MNNNKKYSGVLAAIALSAVYTQVMEEQEINVDSAKVSDTLKQQVTDNFTGDDIAFLSENAEKVAKGIKVDDQAIDVDITALMAAVSGGSNDSTYISSSAVARPNSGYSTIAATCYMNCHVACHGSRGWR